MYKLIALYNIEQILKLKVSAVIVGWLLFSS